MEKEIIEVFKKYSKSVDTVYNTYNCLIEEDWPNIAQEVVKLFRHPPVISWVAVSDRLPEFGVTVLVYCRIYGLFLSTYEFIGEFQGEKYGNWRDFNGNIGILPPVFWLEIPDPPISSLSKSQQPFF